MALAQTRRHRACAIKRCLVRTKCRAPQPAASSAVDALSITLHCSHEGTRRRTAADGRGSARDPDHLRKRAHSRACGDRRRGRLVASSAGRRCGCDVISSAPGSRKSPPPHSRGLLSSEATCHLATLPCDLVSDGSAVVLCGLIRVNGGVNFPSRGVFPRAASKVVALAILRLPRQRPLPSPTTTGNFDIGHSAASPEMALALVRRPNRGRPMAPQQHNLMRQSLGRMISRAHLN